jgi:type I restriction enzyme S subunit
MMRTTNVKNGRVDLSAVRFVDESTYLRWARRGEPREGDIVLTREAPLGEVGMLTDADGVFLGQRLVLYRPDPDKTDRRFLLHAMRSPSVQAQIRAFGSGATVEHMRVPDCAELLIESPDVSEQRRIGAVLSAFDQLIEINERRIELLEDLAGSLYREWFVRYRFPSHEDVEFADSEIGMIPAGWEAGRLDDHVVLARGFDLPTGQRSDGHVPVVSASGIGGSHSEAKVKGPGVITGRSGTIGRVEYVSNDFWPLNTTLWVKEFRVATPRTAYLLLESIGLESHATGAAVPTLNRNHIHGLPMVKPPRSVVEEFDRRAAPMFELAFALRARNKSLVATRDLLLPRLVTGLLDISDVDLGDLLPAEAA